MCTSTEHNHGTTILYVHIRDCNSCFTCIPIHNHIFLVLRNLTNARRRRNISSKYDYGTYGQTPNSNSENVDCDQNGHGMVLEEDRPTPIDVAIAATRDLHMQQAKGYGAFALRSVMLIRYSQKVSSYPYYIYKIYCRVTTNMYNATAQLETYNYPDILYSSVSFKN